MKWTGLAFPNGTYVSLHGNIQQIQAQLLEINPNYGSDFPPSDKNEEVHIELRKRHTVCYNSINTLVYTMIWPSLSPKLSKTNNYQQSTLSCHLQSRVTIPAPIESGIDRLIQVGGACHVGPLQCTNIYCSQDASIRLCNSNNWDIKPQCNYLATYAVSILAACSFVADGTVEYKGGHPSGIELVGGTLWDTDQYLIDVTSNQENGECWVLWDEP